MRGRKVEGQAVRLRPVEARDAEGMFELISDREAMRRLGVTETLTREAVEQWAAMVADVEGRVDYAITLNDDEYAGEAVLYDLDVAAATAKLRLVLRAAFRQEDIEAEAARLVLGEAFEFWHLARVTFEPLSVDERGVALAQSLGLEEDSSLGERAQVKGEGPVRRVYTVLSGTERPNA